MYKAATLSGISQRSFRHCFKCSQGSCSPPAADAYLCPNQKHSVKFNCCSKAHFSIQTGNSNRFETLILLASFNREQLSAPSSTSNISISCSVFPQTHTHAALLTTTQPNLKSAKAKHIQQLFPFRMPFVIQTWGWCTRRRWGFQIRMSKQRPNLRNIEHSAVFFISISQGLHSTNKVGICGRITLAFGWEDQLEYTRTTARTFYQLSCISTFGFKSLCTCVFYKVFALFNREPWMHTHNCCLPTYNELVDMLILSV